MAAFALHAAGAWAIHAFYMHRPAATENVGTRETEVDLVLDPPAAAPSAPVNLDPPSAAPQDTTPRSIAKVEATSSSPTPHTGELSAPTEALASSAAPAAEGAWSFSATGVGAFDAGAPVERIAEATREGVRATIAADEARRDKLPLYTPRDIELGLAPGGQFVQQTRDAVRSSRTPSFGHAMLEFQTNASGLVVSVRVLEASSDRSAWDEIAAELVSNRRVRPEKVPPGANGIAVTLDVTSAMKTVSGSKTNSGTLEKIVGAINDPIDTIIDAKNPPQRVVAARVVAVQAF